MNRRFVISKDNEFIAAVYAERLEMVGGAQNRNSYNGCQTGHFYRDQEIVASVEVGPHIQVVDSGGVEVPLELREKTPDEIGDFMDAWRLTAPAAIVETVPA